MDKFSELSAKERIAYLASKMALAKSYESPVLTVPVPDLELVLAELEAKDKRIAELEEQKARWVSVAKELGSKCDALEAKLDTPVPVPSFDCYKPDVARELQEGFKNTVRAAGFTVEGDE
ncbi:hypothetical protein ACAY19_000822 [Serratia liquefaciens]